jgi:hypothetical protein
MAYLYYMKKLFFSIVCILLINTARAQKDVLQFDEDNKYVYYQVVDKKGFSADTLYNRGLVFMKSQGLKADGDAKAGTITAKPKLVVYTNSLVSKKEAGEVSYILNVDTKDQKYRYKFAGFVFKPYKINRYGSMATQPGVEIPLEKLWTKYSAKETDALLDQIGTFCKTTATKLLQQMDKVPVLRAEEPVKKVATDKW